MNPGLLHKSLREIAPVTAIFGGALLAVVTLLAYVLPAFQESFAEQLWQIEFVRTVVQAMLGAELGDQIGPEMAGAFAWSHPMVIAVICAHAIVVCSRVPAGEVDRGTIDLLLGLPVSRWQVHVTETVVWGGAVAFLVVCGLVGHVAGTGLAGATDPPTGWMRAAIAANLLALALAFGALTWAIAAHSDRRGKAMGLALGIVLPAFLLNYLRQFWAPAEWLSFVSPLRYYQPFAIMRSAAWPWDDLAVLLGIAVVAWGAAGRRFARRDLCTT